MTCDTSDTHLRSKTTIQVLQDLHNLDCFKGMEDCLCSDLAKAEVHITLVTSSSIETIFFNHRQLLD